MTDTQALTDAKLRLAARLQKENAALLSTVADMRTQNDMLNSELTYACTRVTDMRKALEAVLKRLYERVYTFNEGTPVRADYRHMIECIEAALDCTPSPVGERKLQAWSDDFRRASVVTTTAPVGERNAALEEAAKVADNAAYEAAIAHTTPLIGGFAFLIAARIRALAQPATEG